MAVTTGFRLRRIGVEDSSFSLLPILTRIGRHSESDLCLISNEHPCMISRLHAEIFCVDDGSVDLKYMIRDKSVNGTYINDIRVDTDHILSEGEIITFGRYGGHTVKPGHAASSPYPAEFRFVFERNTIKNSLPVERPGVHTSESRTCFADCSSDDDYEKVVKQSVCRAQQFSQADSDDCSTHGLELLHAASQTCSDNAAETKTKLGEYEPVTVKETMSTAMANRIFSTDSCSTVHYSASPGTLSVSSLQNLSASSAPAATMRRRSPLSGVNKQLKTVVSSNDSGDAAYPRRQLLSDDDAKLRRHSLPVSKTIEPDLRHGGQKRRALSVRGTRSKRPAATSKKQMYHYAGDKCAAVDCLKPKASTVSWVQCDDCDAWYHTACAGCTDSITQLEMMQFHCGCA